MLTIQTLIDAMSKLREVPRAIYVSPEIWTHWMTLPKKDRTVNFPPDLVELNIVVDHNYRPVWWSEHFRDHMVLHTETAHIKVMGSGLRAKALPNDQYEIIRPESSKEKA